MVSFGKCCQASSSSPWLTSAFGAQFGLWYTLKSIICLNCPWLFQVTRMICSAAHVDYDHIFGESLTNGIFHIGIIHLQFIRLLCPITNSEQKEASRRVNLVESIMRLEAANQILGIQTQLHSRWQLIRIYLWSHPNSSYLCYLRKTRPK